MASAPGQVSLEAGLKLGSCSWRSCCSHSCHRPQPPPLVDFLARHTASPSPASCTDAREWLWLPMGAFFVLVSDTKLRYLMPPEWEGAGLIASSCCKGQFHDWTDQGLKSWNWMEYIKTQTSALNTLFAKENEVNPILGLLTHPVEVIRLFKFVKVVFQFGRACAHLPPQIGHRV